MKRQLPKYVTLIAAICLFITFLSKFGAVQPWIFYLSFCFLIVSILDFFQNGFHVTTLVPWAAIWLGLLWEVISAYQGSVNLFRVPVQMLWRFSFFFWLSLIIGIAVRIRFLLDQTHFSELTIQGIRSDSPIWKFLVTWKSEILILLITILSLKPLFHSGYYWDDAVNSTAYLFEKYDQLPLLQNLLIFMRKYLELGRINVLSCYYYFLFYIENVSIYKAIIIGLVGVDMLLLGLLVREIGGSRKISRLAMLLIPVLIQFRAYQDPVTGFYGLMQVIMAELMLSAFFLLRFLHTGKRKYYLLSLIPFLIGLMTYEVCFPFILLIPLIVFLETKSWKKTFRYSIPFVLIVFLLIGAIWVVRMNFAQESTYPGVAFSLDLFSILRTYFYQLMAALPLSFYFSGRQLAILGSNYLAQDVLSYQLTDVLKAVKFDDWIVLLLAVFVLIWNRVKQFENPRYKNWGLLFGMGLSFWLLPAVTIAVSQRYQGQLIPGLGYLPVFMEYFGVSLLIVSLYIIWLQKIRNPQVLIIGKAAAICILFLTILMNQQNNRTVNELLNRSFLYPREGGEKALQAGMLDFLPNQTVLVSANPGEYIWEANWANVGLYPEYYAVQSKRDLQAAEIQTMNLSEFIDHVISSEDANSGSLLIHPDGASMIAYDGGADFGLAKMGRINQLKTDSSYGTNLETLTDHVLFFIRGKFPEKAQITYQTSDGRTIWLKMEDGWLVRRSKDGNLYQLAENDEIVFETLDLYGF